MIICSCNVLSKKDIKECINRRDGSCCISDVYTQLGCKPVCGGCMQTIASMVDEHRDGFQDAIIDTAGSNNELQQKVVSN